MRGGGSEHGRERGGIKKRTQQGAWSANSDGSLKDASGKTAFDYAGDNTNLQGTDAYTALQGAQN